VKDKLSDYR